MFKDILVALWNGRIHWLGFVILYGFCVTCIYTYKLLEWWQSPRGRSLKNRLERVLWPHLQNERERPDGAEHH